VSITEPLIPTISADPARQDAEVQLTQRDYGLISILPSLLAGVGGYAP